MYLLWALLKLLAFFLQCLPRLLFLAFARLLGSFLYVAKFRRKIAESNIQLAFPQLSTEEKIKLCRKSYEELGILFLEMLRFFYRFGRFLDRNCLVEGEDNLRSALAEGRGVLIMTAHLGNWEVLAAHGTSCLKVPVTMVTKRLKPEAVQRIMETERSLLGVKMAFEPKTMQNILRALKAKEIVGFVMDQYTGAPVGARVPFFGVPVGSHTALAAIALRTEAVVVPAIAFRRGTKYICRFEKALPLIREDDKERSILLNTAQYVRHTEKWVREFPEQWLWIHRRWKGDLSPLPPNSPGEMLR